MKIVGDETISVFITASGRKGLTNVLHGLAQLQALYSDRGLDECERLIHDASDLIGMLEGSRRPDDVVGLIIDGDGRG